MDTMTTVTSSSSPEEKLRAENAAMCVRLEEAEETLRAIRSGEVDALVVETDQGPQIFSLDAAQAASNRFRGEILAQVSDAVIAVDADQRVTYINAAAERQYRVSASDVLGRQFSQIFSRQWPSAEAEAALGVALLEHGEWRGELTDRTHDGREIVVDTSITSLRDASGMPAGYVAVIRDITERKRRAEESQRVSVLLDTVLLTAPVGFCFLDRNLRYVRVNERLAEMNGIPAEAHLGRHVSEIVPALVEPLRDVTSRILATGRAVLDHEFSGETSAVPGVMRFWNESWYPVRDGAGEVLGFGGIVEEITARKQAQAQMIMMNERLLVASVHQHELTEKAEWLSAQLQTDLTVRMAAEEALRESQHFIHSVLYNLFAFVGVMTTDGTLIDANRSSLEAASIPASEVLGKKFWDCYWWSYSPQIQAQLRDACERAASGEVVRYDVPVRMAGDTRVWIDFQVSPLHDTKGRITHLIPSALEIDVRHAAEEALRESEERFRIMADGLPLMIWVHDAHGQLQFVNQAYREFFGVTAQQVAGRNWHPVVHPEDLASYAGEFNACVRDRRAFHAEVRVRRSDGEWRCIESRARPRFSASGEFLGMVGSSPDITERKRVEQALRESEAHERESRAEAEAANHSKDNFLATLSHELRTPLSAILGWAVLLRTKPPADGKPVRVDIDHGLAVIERNARVQGKLIEEVLDVARITSGKFVLDTRPLELTSLVYAAVDSARPSAEGKGLTLEASHESGADGKRGVWVLGDSSRLQQAVSNLLSNAVKFTPKGGRVSVRVERAMEGRRDIARITVTDTGRGIDAAFLPSAFERFKQAGEGTTRSYGGLGLGLSVVRHIIEAHGGSALAASEGEGKGATFTLELPTTPQTAATPGADTLRAMHAPRLDGVRVLVVDDEEDARMMTATVLEKAGAAVLLAASAEDGHRQAVEANESAQVPHVMVSDIGMPGEDGYAMMRRVRESRASKDFPAVAVTAFAAPEDKRRALVAGFQAHIAKPLDPHELVATVAGLVGKIAP